MSRRSGPPGPRVRLTIVAISGCLGLVAHAALSTGHERVVPVGVESRLFALPPQITVSFMSTARQPNSVILVAEVPPSASTSLLFPAWPMEWAPGTARRTRPFSIGGTWAIDGPSLVRIWRYAADRVGEEGDLYGMGYRLEVKTGRTIRQPDDFLDMTSDETELVPPVAPGLETALDGGTGLYSRDVNSRGRTVILATLSGPDSGSSGPSDQSIVAVSSDPLRTVLPLTHGSDPGLSSDGRQLFFLRGGAVWVLRLRRPLDQLLDESAAPIEIPEGVE